MLRAGAGASTIPLGEASPHLLAVERRVGRGRITMLTHQPARAGRWDLAGPRHDGPPRRPPPARGGRRWGRPVSTATYGPPARPAGGADLTWYRITSRDARPREDAAGRLPKPPKWRSRRTLPARPSSARLLEDETTPRTRSPRSASPTGAIARFPTLSRDLLEEASGITIPSKISC